MMATDPSAARVLHHLRIAVARDHRRRRRRRHAAVVALAAFALSGVAVGATQDWWRDAPPPVDSAVVEIQLAPTRYPDGRLETLADVARARTVARLGDVSIVAAPRGDGDRYCLLPQLQRQPGESAVGAGLGMSCISRGVTGDGGGSTFGTLQVFRGKERWFAYGRFTDDRAEAVDFSKPFGERLHVPLVHGGFFLVAIPRERWPRLDDAFDEVAVLGSREDVLRRACVPFGPAPTSALERRDGGGVLSAEDRDEPCAWHRYSGAEPERVKAGPAPDIATTELGLRAGAPAVIGFWRAGCEECEQMPGLLGWVASAREEVQVIGVHRGELTDEERQPLLRRVRDPGGRIARAFGVGDEPTYLFLDNRGRTRARIVGVPGERELARALLLAR